MLYMLLHISETIISDRIGIGFDCIGIESERFVETGAPFWTKMSVSLRRERAVPEAVPEPERGLEA